VSKFFRGFNVVLTYFDKTPIKNHDDMWMIVSAATDSNVSPDLLKLASCMCNSKNNCSVKEYIREGIHFASAEDPITHHLAISWSIANPVTADQMRYNFSHEFLHKIYSKIAMLNRLPRFAMHISNLAKLSGDERKMKAADEYFRFYREYCEIPQIASGGTDKKAQMTFKYITYTVEEAVEPSLIERMVPEFLDFASVYSKELNGRAKGWTVDDYVAHLHRDNVLFVNVANEASNIYRASLHGMDVSDWRAKVEKAIEPDMKAREIFNFMMVMFEVANEYVNSPEFKRQFIDTAERPFRCD
jgi:hypothetical protein